MSDYPQSYSIRESLATDYPDLVSIAAEVHRLHYAAHPSIFQPVERADPLPRMHFDEVLADAMSTIQVAEIAGAIVGFVIVRVSNTPPIEMLVPRRIVFIDSMVVTEVQRGKGIGQALIEVAILWGRAKDATTVELTVWEFNQRAKMLYERLGFTTIYHKMQRNL